MIQPVNAAQQQAMANPQLLAQQQQQWLLMQQQQQTGGQTGALGTGMLLGQQTVNPYLNAGLNAGVNSGNTYSLTSHINLGSPQVATGINAINSLAAEALSLAPALEEAKRQAQQATALKQQQAQQAAVAAVQQPAAATTAAAPAATPTAADPNAAAQVAAAPTAPATPAAPVAQSRQGAAEQAPAAPTAAPAGAPTSPTALLAQIAAMPSGTGEKTTVPGAGTVDKAALQGLIATLKAPTPKEGTPQASATATDPTRPAAYAETNTPATEAEDPHAGCNHGNEGENASNAPPPTTAQRAPQPLPLLPTQAPAPTTNPASTGGCQCCPGSGTCPPKQLQASANSLAQLVNQPVANQPILPRSAVIPNTGVANPWLNQPTTTTQPFSTALNQSAQITASPWLSQQLNTNQLQPLVNANGQPVAPVVSSANITSRASLIRLAAVRKQIKGATGQQRYVLMPNPSAALTPEQMASFYTPQQIEAAKAAGKDPFYLTQEGYRAKRMMERKNYYLAYKPPSASKIVKPEYTTFSDGPTVGADFSDGSGDASSDSSFA